MSSDIPSTMATPKATATCLTLPEEIIIWEILVRLPPKPLLRCRAVCRSWRRLTSSGDFLLAHHRHQPALPLVYGLDHDADFTGYLDMLPLAHNVAPQLFVCNPTTFQSARLGFDAFILLGFYGHLPTGEYRLLLKPKAHWTFLLPARNGIYYRDQVTGPRDSCYVLSLVFDLPRCIGVSEPSVCYGTPLLLHGCLYWDPEGYNGGTGTITVFDTVAESFRSMWSPVVPDETAGCWFVNKQIHLFEMNGTLGAYRYSSSSNEGSIDIWVLQDYEQELWGFRCHIELPMAEIINKHFRGFYNFRDAMIVADQEGDVHVIVHCNRRLFHVDTEGKLLAWFYRDNQDLRFGPYLFKQSLVRHTFFSKLEPCNHFF